MRGPGGMSGGVCPRLPLGVDAQPCFDFALPAAGPCPAGPGLQRRGLLDDVLRGRVPCPTPLPTGYLRGLKDGPVFAFQNSKPDSLLKMEEEQKLEKCPLSGSRDPKFSFSFNKRLLGYVHAPAHASLPHHTRSHTSDTRPPGGQPG